MKVKDVLLYKLWETPPWLAWTWFAFIVFVVVGSNWGDIKHEWDEWQTEREAEESEAKVVRFTALTMCADAEGCTLTLEHMEELVTLQIEAAKIEVSQ